MSGDVHSFQVILEYDVSDDRAKAMADLLRLVRGVLDVVPVEASFDSMMAETRARTAVAAAVGAAVRPILMGQIPPTG